MTLNPDAFLLFYIFGTVMGGIWLIKVFAVRDWDIPVWFVVFVMALLFSAVPQMMSELEADKRDKYLRYCKEHLLATEHGRVGGRIK